MITSNISLNTIFFTQSEQRSGCNGQTIGYKTPFFIPFLYNSIPFYTHLYQLYFKIKHITSACSSFRRHSKKLLTGRGLFSEIIPSRYNTRYQQWQ